MLRRERDGFIIKRTEIHKNQKKSVACVTYANDQLSAQFIERHGQ
jgi:hypothetical protein